MSFWSTPCARALELFLGLKMRPNMGLNILRNAFNLLKRPNPYSVCYVVGVSLLLGCQSTKSINIDGSLLDFSNKFNNPISQMSNYIDEDLKISQIKGKSQECHKIIGSLASDLSKKIQFCDKIGTDGMLFALGARDGRVFSFDGHNFKLIGTHRSPLLSLVGHPNEKLILSTDSRGGCILWGISEQLGVVGQNSDKILVRSTGIPNFEEFKGVGQFSEDGRFVVLVNGKGEIFARWKIRGLRRNL